MDDPLNAEAQKYFDPYFFLDRLVMPKFYISSTGDEFFLPDDSHYWLKVRNFNYSTVGLSIIGFLKSQAVGVDS